MPNDKNYKPGQATAFVVHALSELNARRQQALDERRAYMEDFAKRSQAMSMGAEEMQQQQQQEQEEQEQVNEYPYG